MKLFPGITVFFAEHFSVKRFTAERIFPVGTCFSERKHFATLTKIYDLHDS
jgi:hypothetical protein